MTETGHAEPVIALGAVGGALGANRAMAALAYPRAIVAITIAAAVAGYAVAFFHGGAAASTGNMAVPTIE